MTHTHSDTHFFATLLAAAAPAPRVRVSETGVRLGAGVKKPATDSHAGCSRHLAAPVDSVHYSPLQSTTVHYSPLQSTTVPMGDDTCFTLSIRARRASAQSDRTEQATATAPSQRSGGASRGRVEEAARNVAVEADADASE